MNDVLIASLKQIAIESPIMIVCLTGIILALVFWKRCPISCLFILIALVILLLVSWINPFMLNFIIHRREETGALYSAMAKQLAVANIISMIFRMIAISLLITAVFLKRKEPTASAAQDLGAPPQKFGSVGLYASMLLCGFLLMVPSLIALFVMISENGDTTLIVAMGILCAVGVISSTIANIYFFVILYRLWGFSISESHRHNLPPSIPTPGQAVGFLFIPFFNFYWVFMAFGKLPNDLNAIAGAKGVNPMMSEGLGISLAVISVLCAIPFLGYISAIVTLILSPIFISSAINTCENLRKALDTQGDLSRQ